MPTLALWLRGKGTSGILDRHQFEPQLIQFSANLPGKRQKILALLGLDSRVEDWEEALGS